MTTYTEDDLLTAFQAGVIAGENKPGTNVSQRFQEFLGVFSEGKVEAAAVATLLEQSAVRQEDAQQMIPGVDWSKY